MVTTRLTLSDGAADHGMVLRGGRIIDPASGLDETGDLVIAQARIVSIGRRGDAPADAPVVDAEGLIVTPGLIDPHVHLREPGMEQAETIESGSRAAAAGGFTTVCCMPNTAPTLDTPEMIEAVSAKGRDALCRVFPVGAATVGRKGERLAEMALMRKAGAVGFSDDGDVIASPAMMSRVLRVAHSLGAAVMQHCQEPTLTVGASMHAGSVSTRLGLTGWPRQAEELIVERDIRLNTGIGARYHVQHASSGGSIDLIRRARADGAPVSVEASPHHLTLTHDACAGFDTAAKMNPPLREGSDIAVLKEGVADGTITVLATDHAPHPAERKALDFAAAPFGIIGLETAVPLYLRALVADGVIGWPRLVELLTLGPAELCGLDRHGLGRLTVGGPADVTVLDPRETWTVSSDTLAGRSVNTPFMGWELAGRAVMTIVGGRVALNRAGARTAGV